jgi:hypothetical protein
MNPAISQLPKWPVTINSGRSASSGATNRTAGYIVRCFRHVVGCIFRGNSAISTTMRRKWR